MDELCQVTLGGAGAQENIPKTGGGTTPAGLEHTRCHRLWFHRSVISLPVSSMEMPRWGRRAAPLPHPQQDLGHSMITSHGAVSDNSRNRDEK